MIHVLTVHWIDDRWVDTQLDYFRRFLLDQEYLVYAFLNYLPEDHSHKFFYSSTEPIEHHAIKLNLLADLATMNASNPNDILIFVDGDAFPIKNLQPFLDTALSVCPLVAIQRLENLGDPQPHPCFCATTVGFWKSIRGDWKNGFQWQNETGEMVSDIGGNLLGILQSLKIQWNPLLRSNKLNLHPLWFGVYGDIIYHHGAGFRAPISRLDTVALESKLGKLVPSSLIQAAKGWLKSVPGLKKFRHSLRDNNPAVWQARELSDRVLCWIREDPDFFLKFTQEYPVTPDVNKNEH